MLMLAATASASLRRLLDLAELDRGLGRQLAVELRIILELLDHRAHQRLRPRRPRARSISTGSTSATRCAPSCAQRRRAMRALLALDQHAHGAVGQLQQLQHGGDDAEIVERLAVGIVLGRIELRDEEDALVRRHRAFERGHRFVAADEQRHDHLREDDDVAQRKDGIGFGHAILHRPADGPSCSLYGAATTASMKAAVAIRTARPRSPIDPAPSGGATRDFPPSSQGSRSPMYACCSRWPRLCCSLPFAASALSRSTARAARSRRSAARRAASAECSATQPSRGGGMFGAHRSAASPAGARRLAASGGSGRRSSFRSARCSATRSSACSTATSRCRPRPRPRRRSRGGRRHDRRPGRARPGPASAAPRPSRVRRVGRRRQLHDGHRRRHRRRRGDDGRQADVPHARRPTATSRGLRRMRRGCSPALAAGGAAARAGRAGAPMDPDNPTCPPARTGRTIGRCASPSQEMDGNAGPARRRA